MKTSKMNIGRGCMLLLSILVAFFCFESVEGSKLKQARRSIEDSDESSTSERKWFPRRRLTLADDVFTTTERDFEVRGYHRATVETLIKIIGKVTRGISSVINFTKRTCRRTIDAVLHWTIGLLQSMQNKLQETTSGSEVAINETIPNPSDVPTISSLYDSLSSVMSTSTKHSDSSSVEEDIPVKRQQPSSTDNSGTKTSTSTSSSTPNKQTTKLSTPTNNDAQKATTKTAPLRSNKNLPKATSRGALNKKSVMEDLATGGSSAFDDSMDFAVASDEDDVTVPATSLFAGLFPTLVTGLVFATAGSMVGYLWNGDWTETASGVMDYFWGETETLEDDTAATTATSEQHHDTFSSTAIPVTPDKY